MRFKYTARSAAVLVVLATTAMPVAAQTNFFGIDRAAHDSGVPADRPGFGDNIGLVPKGYYLAEGGVRFDDNQGGGSSTTIPSSFLLRTGIDENIELRVGFNGYVLNSPGEDGAGDATVGAKIRVHDETTYTPAVSLLPTVSLPVGSDAVSATKAEPELHFIWGKTLTSDFSLGGNVNLAERVDAAENYTLETAVSLAANYGFTDRLSGYAEYYTILPENDGRDTHAINGGVAFVPGHLIQLDAYVGTGLNDTTSNIFFGGGIAKLF
ncbi:transporter [uncultured Salinisphaera sp.]|uniref:transporter n=1 Tax=uncultured Salinisphaera sp. TaxID=359372 RepID=UPI0032B190CC|tara:strand:- start:1782 stop:2582 length:801 start_codon:yes stop_codon:yes gene_type:complete